MCVVCVRVCVCVGEGGVRIHNGISPRQLVVGEGQHAELLGHVAPGGHFAPEMVVGQSPKLQIRHCTQEVQGAGELVELEREREEGWRGR